MPFSSGIYSLPPGVQAITGTNIESAKYNLALGDVASALTELSGVKQPNVGGEIGLELGINRLAGERYIDLHTDGNPATDYNFRILRGSGTNGAAALVQAGTGPVDIAGGSNLTRDGFTIYHAGNAPTFQWNLIGSPVFAFNNSGVALAPTDTVAGSAINAAGVSGTSVATSISLSGTWRCLGFAPAGFATFFARIA